MFDYHVAFMHAPAAVDACQTDRAFRWNVERTSVSTTFRRRAVVIFRFIQPNQRE